MMEKLDEDMNEWERRHQNTWLGRAGLETGPMNWGLGMSAQADLMSPFGIVDFAREPSLFNLMKVGYNPAIAYGGFSLAQMLTGTKIGFAERILHSADMTRQTVRTVAIGGARAVRAASPYALLAAYTYGAYHMIRSNYEQFGVDALPLIGFN